MRVFGFFYKLSFQFERYILEIMQLNEKQLRIKGFQFEDGNLHVLKSIYMVLFLIIDTFFVSFLVLCDLQKWFVNVEVAAIF